jgi:hypothetical protein
MPACGPGGEAPDGGGEPDGGGDERVPAAPEIPWLSPDGTVALDIAPPELTPCPPGHRPVSDPGGVVTCDPYPEGGPAACPEGLAHFPGEPGCAPIGSPCPAGDFPDDLPPGTVHVLAGAAGGDGSRDLPYGRIADALGGAAAGSTIAVGRGRYDELVTVTGDVTLRGACVAGTTLQATASDPQESVLEVRGAAVVVRDLTIADSPRGAARATGAGSELTLEGVVISGCEVAAVYGARGAALTARTVVVRDTRARASDGMLGRGLGVESGATAAVSRVLFEGNRDAGVSVLGPRSSVELSDVVVRDTESRASDGGGGRGLSVQGEGRAEVRRALFERNREIGIYVSNAGTTAELIDVVVRATRGRAGDAGGGRGLVVQSGATVAASRMVLEQNRDVAVSVAHAGTVLMLTDAVVRDTEGQVSDGTFGRALGVQSGARAVVIRAVLERNHELGVYAADAGTRVELTDLVVRDTESQTSDGTSGRGLAAQDGAAVVVQRALFERNRDLGIAAAGPGTSAELADVLVRDTAARASDGGFGRGLAAQEGATLLVSRALIERNHDVGISVHQPGTTAELTDVVVRDTESQPSDGLGGRGLGVQIGAAVTVSRAILERNRELGVYASDSATVRLTDVAVRDTAAAADRFGGIGAGSYGEATVVLERFVVSGSALAGVQLARGGTIDLSEGEVSRNLIGANVQTEGYDLTRLMDRVRYRDNGRDLAADALPVPAPGLPPEEPP